MNNNNIFIINGQKTVGKDYLSKTISKFMGVDSVNISTVDVVKEMCKLIGYEEHDAVIKDKFRVVLSDAKDSIDKNLNKAEYSSKEIFRRFDSHGKSPKTTRAYSFRAYS